MSDSFCNLISTISLTSGGSVKWVELAAHLFFFSCVGQVSYAPCMQDVRTRQGFQTIGLQPERQIACSTL